MRLQTELEMRNKYACAYEIFQSAQRRITGEISCNFRETPCSVVASFLKRKFVEEVKARSEDRRVTLNEPNFPPPPETVLVLAVAGYVYQELTESIMKEITRQCGPRRWQQLSLNKQLISN